MASRQVSFLPSLGLRTELDHGGDIGQGRRKERRPFDPKRPLHVVLRSTRARGEWSLLRPRNVERVEQELARAAKKYEVKLYRSVNVGNHLHLLVQARKRQDFQSFLRVVSGRIAMLVTGARKGVAIGRFWDRLAYSRVVGWGREFDVLRKYLVKNLFESKGFWNRKQHPHLQLMWISMRDAGISGPGD